MNPRSIGFQLTAWYAGVIAVVFLLLGGFMYLGMKHHLEKNLRETQSKRAGVIAETLVARVAQLGEAHVIQEIRESYAPELNSRFIRVTRPDGSVLYVCGVPADLSFDPTKVPPAATTVARAYARVESPPESESLLIVTGPVPTAAGTFRVEVGASLGPVETVLREWLVTFALAFPFLLAVAAGGGWFLARRALEPVRKIIHGTEQISSHNLGERLPVPRTGDELERLSTALNQMIARLDEALSHNRRFMADASHELRTPLTILRGELETMLQQTDGAPELQDRIGSVLEEVERLAKIVENLFALSRLDAGEAQAESVPFDLGQLAATTAEQMSLLAEDKQVSLNCLAPRAVSVEGDRARLKQVVVNLLDNAVKYTPPGGSVTLSVVAAPNIGKAVLEVTDTGMGIPAGALPHVFERFFRVDKARSRELGGAGIGLSIVKAICTAHGGQVEVASEEGRGARFRVLLPLAENSDETKDTHNAG
ncbi:MAG: integral membrane sensor signal transduction histidine kinase [Limisphaerales bacterium]|nr:MAG: integral membrane sensor signal transduction histidine kinase [Limisphaerales bacterium]KAG0507405.1 MAG: integral membrane sensor signal transduction histidine kinase [Limisphaerales bacterium]TXT51355.1 MAG: integral membrane sensor signal transduction histidine kinase [Limisphaerales bacterium]